MNIKILFSSAVTLQWDWLPLFFSSKPFSWLQLLYTLGCLHNTIILIFLMYILYYYVVEGGAESLLRGRAPQKL